MTNPKAAILTDATHFVGDAIATRLATDGYAVYAVDPAFDDAEKRVAFEALAPGITALEHQGAEDVAMHVESLHGKIDLLASNDAWPAIRATVDEIESVALHETFEALVFKPFAFARAVAKRMKPRGEGKIIFLTSAAPLNGLPNYAMYCAARGAMNAATKAMAKELAAFNIQVNAIAPNFVANPDYFPPELMADPDRAAKILKNVPLGRLGRPEEVAGMVAQLASDDGGFFTGQVIAASGGWA
ncbi:SDR family oxidoreductase [Pyruvatibacter sp.]|uniref:SDR family oxidoreductase n=1 Tax=Pyruvatibacter sp. TaxID=1981328 RepID=UPI0032F08341